MNAKKYRKHIRTLRVIRYRKPKSLYVSKKTFLTFRSGEFCWLPLMNCVVTREWKYNAKITSYWWLTFRITFFRQ